MRVSQGKTRPSLPRAEELPTLERRPNGPTERSSDGRFGPGNGQAKARGMKAAIRAAMGPAGGNADATRLHRDAMRVFGALLRSVGREDAPVRAMAALHSRHLVLAGWYSELAATRGLDTEAGMAALEVADRQSARAERTLVTCMAVAGKLAESAPRGPVDPLAAFRDRGDA